MTTVLLSDPAVVEFQVTQTPHGADVSVATKAECNTESLRRGLVDLMAGAGLADPQVTIRQVDALDRLWSGKSAIPAPLIVAGPQIAVGRRVMLRVHELR